MYAELSIPHGAAAGVSPTDRFETEIKLAGTTWSTHKIALGEDDVRFQRSTGCCNISYLSQSHSAHILVDKISWLRAKTSRISKITLFLLIIWTLMFGIYVGLMMSRLESHVGVPSSPANVTFYIIACLWAFLTALFGFWYTWVRRLLWFGIGHLGQEDAFCAVSGDPLAVMKAVRARQSVYLPFEEFDDLDDFSATIDITSMFGYLRTGRDEVKITKSDVIVMTDNRFLRSSCTEIVPLANVTWVDVAPNTRKKKTLFIGLLAINFLIGPPIYAIPILGSLIILGLNVGWTVNWIISLYDYVEIGVDRDTSFKFIIAKNTGKNFLEALRKHQVGQPPSTEGERGTWRAEFCCSAAEFRLLESQVQIIHQAPTCWCCFCTACIKTSHHNALLEDVKYVNLMQQNLHSVRWLLGMWLFAGLFVVLLSLSNSPGTQALQILLLSMLSIYTFIWSLLQKAFVSVGVEPGWVEQEYNYTARARDVDSVADLIDALDQQKRLCSVTKRRARVASREESSDFAPPMYAEEIVMTDKPTTTSTPGAREPPSPSPSSPTPSGGEADATVAPTQEL